MILIDLLIWFIVKILVIFYYKDWDKFYILLYEFVIMDIKVLYIDELLILLIVVKFRFLWLEVFLFRIIMIM